MLASLVLFFTRLRNLYRLHRRMYRPRMWALRTAIYQAWHF